MSVAALTHNGASNFAVHVFSSDGRRDLLVNEIGAYQGQRPVMAADGMVRFSIEADGPWTIRLTALETDGEPAFSGKGDAVSKLFNPPGLGAWEFSHDGESNFAVLLHCSGGRDLVQNEIGRFQGSKIVTFGRGPCFWEVQADGNWSLKPR